MFGFTVAGLKALWLEVPELQSDEHHSITGACHLVSLTLHESAGCTV